MATIDLNTNTVSIDLDELRALITGGNVSETIAAIAVTTPEKTEKTTEKTAEKPRKKWHTVNLCDLNKTQQKVITSALGKVRKVDETAYVKMGGYVDDSTGKVDVWARIVSGNSKGRTDEFAGCKLSSKWVHSPRKGAWYCKSIASLDPEKCGKVK